MGYGPWGLEKLDMTEQLHFHLDSEAKEILPKKTKATGHISPECTHRLSKQILTHRIQPWTQGIMHQAQVWACKFMVSAFKGLQGFGGMSPLYND